MPAVAKTSLLLTVRDYRMLPEAGPRYQLIEGNLYMSPAPQFFHQDIVANLLTLLRIHAKRHHLGKVVASPVDVYLDQHNAYQPDLIFVSKDRLSIIHKNGVHGAPDLIVEILSPGTKRLDLGPKRQVYALRGVKEFWVVDPVKREVSVYLLQKNGTKPIAVWKEGNSFTSELLPGLEVAVADVFNEEV